MKKSHSLFFLLAVVLIAFSSCSKEDVTCCAVCVEANSGYKPADYCGPENQVDNYISELKKQGSAAGQNWSCYKE